MDMRNTVVILATILVFVGVYYGRVLQDRMMQKARKPGTSIFSVGNTFRALATKEAILFVLLIVALVAFAATLIGMDQAGYLGPR